MVLGLVFSIKLKKMLQIKYFIKKLMFSFYVVEYQKFSITWGLKPDSVLPQ